MAQETPEPMAIFNSSLLDAAGQPKLVKDSCQCHELIWTLLNNQSEKLVVTPFDSGGVNQNQYHFVFEFAPGALTKEPTLRGWDVYPVRDNKGGINSLYVALSGSKPLIILPGDHNAATLFYTDVIQEDSNNSKVGVTWTTGQRVALGGNLIPGKPFGPRYLTLVQGNTPSVSAPPLAVDFVGRRTVLNDGQTSNGFTFALTNMTQADLTLTSKVIFTVWFDAAANQTNYPWALAQVQDLVAKDFILTPPSPQSDWSVSKLSTMLAETPVNVEWQINVTSDFVLKKQEPVVFTFSGLRTDLDPGFTRMYLRFENLPGFSPAVLIGVLEKTPLGYGTNRGQGLYLSAGIPKTLPAPNYDSGLFVEQLGDGAAAIFNGGRVGIGTASSPPISKLQILDGNQQPEAGTLILGPGNLMAGVTLRFGCQPDYSWLQSHGNKPLAINPIAGKDGTIINNVGIGTAKPGSALSVNGGVAIGNDYAQGTPIAANNLAVEGKVGIGTPAPGSSLSVDGGVAIGKDYAQNTSIPANNLAVEGSVGIGTTTPGSSLSVNGGVAIGKDYSQKTTTIAENNLAVEGNVGIGITTPGFPLNFPEVLGDKISLWGSSGIHYGFGVASYLLQIHTDTSSADIAFGYGSSSNFTSTMRVQGVGNLQLGAASDSQIALTTATYTAFCETAHHAEICNDVNSFQALMLCGNRSRTGAGNPRWVQVWDNLEVKNNLYVTGKAAVYFPAYGSWWSLGYRGGNNGAWYDSATAPPAPSDLRLKSKLQSIPSALDRVRRLRGVTYRWNENALRHFTRDIETTISAGPNATEQENQDVWQAERDRRRHRLATTQVGVIAQEVEAVLPEAVTTGEDGYKSVNYQQLIALLIEAIKEQDVAVKAQAALAARHQTEIEELKQAVRGKSKEVRAKRVRDLSNQC